MLAIKKQKMCSVHSTAHFKERKSIVTCLTEAHSDQIVGMLLVRQKQPIAKMHFEHST